MVESVNRNPNEIANDWQMRSWRPLLVVDEARAQTNPIGREWVGFFCVVTTVGQACRFLQEFQSIRESLHATDVSYKSVNLHRKSNPRRHQQILSFLESETAAMPWYVAMTTQHQLDRMRDDSVKARLTIGNPHPDRPAEIGGRELLPAATMMREVALRRGYVNEQVDVLIDRSKQFGLDPKTRNLPPNVFEVLGPGSFNAGPGGVALDPYCPAEFRLIAASDQTPGLRDLLLLPDFVGYRNRLRLHEEYKAHPETDNHYMWFKTRDDISNWPTIK